MGVHRARVIFPYKVGHFFNSAGPLRADLVKFAVVSGRVTLGRGPRACLAPEAVWPASRPVPPRGPLPAAGGQDPTLANWTILGGFLGHPWTLLDGMDRPLVMEQDIWLPHGNKTSGAHETGQLAKGGTFMIPFVGFVCTMRVLRCLQRLRDRLNHMTPGGP
jgi:hypothetical protein